MAYIDTFVGFNIMAIVGLMLVIGVVLRAKINCIYNTLWAVFPVWMTVFEQEKFVFYSDCCHMHSKSDEFILIAAKSSTSSDEASCSHML